MLTYPDHSRALTLRRPWAGAVLLLGKDIENRSWPPPPALIGVRLLIHNGHNTDERGFDVVREHAHGDIATALAMPAGIIAGSVLVTGWTRESTSVWSSPGAFHWQLAQPLLFTDPISARGWLGVWRATGL